MVLLLFFKTLLPKDIEYVIDHDSYPKKTNICGVKLGMPQAR
jgi:hypothetical protein